MSHLCDVTRWYGVATISRLLKIIGLFCKRALQKRPIFFKETYNLKEPTNRSHPISCICDMTQSCICGARPNSKMHMCDRTQSGHVCATWLIHTTRVRNVSFISRLRDKNSLHTCVTWLIHTTYVCRDGFIYWMCNMTHLYQVCATWLICITYVRQDSFIRMCVHMSVNEKQGSLHRVSGSFDRISCSFRKIQCFYIEYRAIFVEYRALFTKYKGLYIECRALLIEYKALFTKYRALFIEYRAVFIEYRAYFMSRGLFS